MRALLSIARNGLLPVALSVAMLSVSSAPAFAQALPNSGPTTGPTCTSGSDCTTHGIMHFFDWITGHDGGNGPQVPMTSGERTTSGLFGGILTALGAVGIGFAVAAIIPAVAITLPVWGTVALAVGGVVALGFGLHFLLRAIWGKKSDNTYHPQNPPIAPLQPLLNSPLPPMPLPPPPTTGPGGLGGPGGNGGPGGSAGPGTPPAGGSGFPVHGPSGVTTGGPGFGTFGGSNVPRPLDSTFHPVLAAPALVPAGVAVLQP